MPGWCSKCHPGFLVPLSNRFCEQFIFSLVLQSKIMQQILTPPRPSAPAPPNSHKPKIWTPGQAGFVPKKSLLVPRKKREKQAFSPFSPEAQGVDMESLVVPDHPPTPPNDEIKGKTITGEMVKEWPKHHEDRWRTNEPSYRQWALLEESHERHREKPLKCPIFLPVGFFLLNSRMGSGKNMLATFYAACMYAFGWSVASTSATKFGKHIGPSELYHFGEQSPIGAFIICDEVHTVFHSNTTGANREVAFQDHSTSMRKRDTRFFGMSASKRVSPTYKAIVDWLGYVHPLVYNRRRMSNGWPTTWRFVNWYGPKPYDRDDYEVEKKWEDGVDVDKWPEYFDSDLLLEACKLFDSWSTVEALWGDGYNADKEREDRNASGKGEGEEPERKPEDDPAFPARMVAIWYQQGVFNSQEEALASSTNRSTTQKRKQSVALDSLLVRFEEMGHKMPAATIRRSLSARGVSVSQRGSIDINEIAVLYQRLIDASSGGGTPPAGNEDDVDDLDDLNEREFEYGK